MVAPIMNQSVKRKRASVEQMFESAHAACKEGYNDAYRLARRFGVVRHTLNALRAQHDALSGRSMLEALGEQDFDFDCIVRDRPWSPASDAFVGHALRFLEDMLEVEEITCIEMLMYALPEDKYLTRQLLLYQKRLARGERMTTFYTLDRALRRSGKFRLFSQTYQRIVEANSEWIDEDE